MSFFENVEHAPADPILGLTKAFRDDPRDNKVNLGVGLYRTAELKPLILGSVKKAEALLIVEEDSKDYLPIDGDPFFARELEKLIFGADCKPLLEKKIYTAQTVGGTAALSVAARFLFNQGFLHVHLSNPTWPNHQKVFSHAGFQVHFYPYYHVKKHAFDFEGLCDAIAKMPEKSVLILQASSHNPTGIDPTMEEWDKLSDLMRERAIFPIIDFAYQGFGDGIEEDAKAIRSLAAKGLEFFVAYSCSKNFGLYGERVGALCCLCTEQKIAENIASHLRIIIRGMYSNPPCHGARIVTKILMSAVLRKAWEKEVEMMRERISQMRTALVTELASNSSDETHDFGFISSQKGMFSYTGLGRHQVEQLISDYAIYLPKNGRINVAGLNPANLAYVAEAICNV